MYASIYDYSKSDGKELFAIGFTFLLMPLYGCMFVMINRRNFAANIASEVLHKQFQNFKMMFNSLQEGIVIIDENELGQQGLSVNYKMSFSNQLASSMFNVVHSKFDLDTMKQRIFYQYKGQSEAIKAESMSQIGQSQKSQHSAYSVYDLLSMSENEICQKVFMFESGLACS